MDSGFAAFIAISVVVIVAPGQDTALIIRNTLLGGRPAGFATAVGITAGQQVWTLAAALGLTALLIASEPAFMAVRLVGAAYLIWLGMQALWSAIRLGDRSHEPGTRRVASGLSTRTALRQGVISNVSNPKMAILFTSLLPQFVPAESPALGMVAGLVFLGDGHRLACRLRDRRRASRRRAATAAGLARDPCRDGCYSGGVRRAPRDGAALGHESPNSE